MSSQTREERGDTNRLDVRTLVIASFSAAVAAIVVSRVWASGTPIAAAATPVIVTILKEMLDRPTAKIAEKVTVQSRALPETEVREPAAGHVGRDIRVYRQQPRAGLAGRVNPKIVAITAALAFVIAGVFLTAGQLAIGNPFGSDGNGAIILGQHKKQSKSDDDAQQNTTTEPQRTAPQQTTPEAAPDQQQRAPVEPEQDQKTTPQQTTPQQVAPDAQTQTTPGTVQP